VNPASVSDPRRRRALWLTVLGILVVLLAAAVFTLGSLNVPIEPRTRTEFIALYALSTFILSVFIVFGAIFLRALLRAWAERQAGRPGSRFKWKLVMGALAISLLPVVFMFIISYGLWNRTLAKWFPRPLEAATEESRALLDEFIAAEHARLRQFATEAARGERSDVAAQPGVDAAWWIEMDGTVTLLTPLPVHPDAEPPPAVWPRRAEPRFVRVYPQGLEVWEAGGIRYVGARAPPDERGAQIVAARRAPEGFLERYEAIETEHAMYLAHRQETRAYTNQALLALLAFTVLLLFSATWFALFLSKMVTVPIEALAEATGELARGNLDHRVKVAAHDELGTLVASFNEMTAQLGRQRRQIEEFTEHLQTAVAELDQRRKLIEAILENIPTGVLSLDGEGRLVRVNRAVSKIFGPQAAEAHTLAELVGEEAARGVEQLMRRSLRMGVASKELAIELPGRVLHAAVTVSSLGPPRANPGYVVVLDDLSELLRAQRAAAWQEVAQRIAHEIKNPLTPIQLSAERLARHIERRSPAGDAELVRLVGECAAMIQRECSALGTLVDEFSQFARFPQVRPALAEVNAIVREALEVFSGRLEGVGVRTELAARLPAVKADRELLRRVLVNLIDNAAEAMEGAPVRRLGITTRAEAEGEAVEIAVADTGHGIGAEDKDLLFLPYFSTRQRGTGLGLAISARIIAEHGGTIRVEDNTPRGARFIIRLPAAEVAAPVRDED
jgi:two-component system, NtrC family, nitrogen regulation sensor histidine kinase NtrY